jgi:hypothetical protein
MEAPVTQSSSFGDRKGRHVLEWVPYLWRNELFPGQQPTGESGQVRLTSLVWLVLVPTLLLYFSLSFHLFEPDEGRYAEIPREMLVRGDWVVPYLQGEPYLDKPPLLYWLVMASYRVFGIHDWAARLVPALALHVCLLLTYLLGRRLLGERPAFWGALLLSLAPGFMSMGRLLIMDSLLTLWVTLSVLAGFEAQSGERLRWRWWLLAAIACGLGILTKGPVAVMLFAPPLWATRRLSGKGCPLPWSALAAFLAVVLTIVLPWYVAICVRLPQFAYYFLWEHNVLRFLAPFDHLEPIWFYGPILLFGFMPATFWAISFVRFLISGDETDRARRGSNLGFVLLSGGWCVLFFSLSGCKLPTYIMPAFPPLALAMGRYLAGSKWPARRATTCVLSASLLFLCAGHNLALPWFAGYRAPPARVDELRDLCEDLHIPVLCYPRNCDSVAFYIGRDDLRCFRSKQTHLLVYDMQQRPRTVLLLTHRHSLDGLRHALTPDLRITEVRHFGLGKLPGLSEAVSTRLAGLLGETSLGLCDLAVVERHSEPKGRELIAQSREPASILSSTGNPSATAALAPVFPTPGP